MLPEAADWMDASAYDYWDDLAPEGLAWEFLRRNRDYQRAFADAIANPDDWGLRRLIDPCFTALDAAIHWRPGISTAEILLASPPLPAPSPDTLSIAFPIPETEQDRHGLFGVIGPAGAEVHISYLGDQVPNGPLCIVVPLDAHLADRIAALARLRRIVEGEAVPDHRLTPDKRRRLRAMARAHDGRRAGATQRQIANAFFGMERIAAENWKTSSLRYTVARLLTDAQSLTSGGYRTLLHATTPYHRPPL